MQDKADSIQRLQAALRNDHLEAKDVSSLLQILKRLRRNLLINLLSSRDRKENRRKTFRYIPRAKDIHFGLIRRVKKNSYVEI